MITISYRLTYETQTCCTYQHYQSTASTHTHPCAYRHRGHCKQHCLSYRFAAICIISGAVTIIADRSRCAHGHFDSFHDIIGLIATIFLVIACGAGTVIVHSAKLKDLTKHEPTRIMHVVTAILTFALTVGVVAICTGLYSNHFRPISHSVARHIFIILLPITAVVILEEPIKTAYSREREELVFLKSMIRQNEFGLVTTDIAIS